MPRSVNIPPPRTRLADAISMFVLNPCSPPRGPPWSVKTPNTSPWAMTRQEPGKACRPGMPAPSGCQLVPEASRSMAGVTGGVRGARGAGSQGQEGERGQGGEPGGSSHPGKDATKGPPSKLVDRVK